VDALRGAGAVVLTVGAIFTYDFPKTKEAFEAAKCNYFTLSDYTILLETAIKHDYVKQHEKAALLKCIMNPSMACMKTLPKVKTEEKVENPFFLK